MKSLGILVGISVLLTSVPPSAVSQEPVLDLAITDLSYVEISQTAAVFEAEVQLATADAIGEIYTSVAFYLDGQDAGSVVYDVVATPAGVCHEQAPPGCDGYCPPTEINGVWVDGFCWAGLSDVCLCTYIVLKPYDTEPVGQQKTLTATVDPDGLVNEMDETNNTMSIGIGPTDIRGSLWGAVKSLYR